MPGSYQQTAVGKAQIVISLDPDPTRALSLPPTRVFALVSSCDPQRSSRPTLKVPAAVLKLCFADQLDRGLLPLLN